MGGDLRSFCCLQIMMVSLGSSQLCGACCARVHCIHNTLQYHTIPLKCNGTSKIHTLWFKGESARQQHGTQGCMMATLKSYWALPDTIKWLSTVKALISLDCREALRVQRSSPASGSTCHPGYSNNQTNPIAGWYENRNHIICIIWKPVRRNWSLRLSPEMIGSTFYSTCAAQQTAWALSKYDHPLLIFSVLAILWQLLCGQNFAHDLACPCSFSLPRSSGLSIRLNSSTGFACSDDPSLGSSRKLCSALLW